MNRVSYFLSCCIFGSAFLFTSAMAGPTADALSNCLAESTSGKDRKDLAQWIFVAMSTHPDIKPFSRVSEANRDEVDKKLAGLATKLMTQTCKAETKAAIQAEGSAAIEAAFGVLGQLAMTELMTNPLVKESFSRYAKYLDKSKFESALE